MLFHSVGKPQNSSTSFMLAIPTTGTEVHCIHPTGRIWLQFIKILGKSNQIMLLGYILIYGIHIKPIAIKSYVEPKLDLLPGTKKRTYQRNNPNFTGFVNNSANIRNNNVIR